MEFIHISDKIRTRKKKILYGFNEWTKAAFYTLVSYGVYIDGFLLLEGEKNIGTFLGKKIYSLEEYSDNEVLREGIIFDLFGDNLRLIMLKGFVGERLLSCNLSKPVIIYGAGKYGMICNEILKKLRVEIVGFCDRDSKKKGCMIDRHPVYSPEALTEFSEKIDVLIGLIPISSDDVGLSLVEQGYIEEYWTNNWWDELYIGKNRIWDLRGILHLRKMAPNIRLIGEVEEIVNIKKQLLSLGISFIYAVDIDNYVGEKEQICFLDRYEIPYEESGDIYVCVSEKREEIISLAKEIGIFRRLADLSGYGMGRKFQWDPNLGYVQGEGMFTHIINRGEELKIGILGGSTSDELFCAHKSWVEYLADYYEKEKKNVTIYNMATVGYTSAQELIRLCRDLIYYQPDIVISYSGVNDPKRSFINDYQTILFQWLNSPNLEYPNSSVIEGIYYGENNVDFAGQWLQHEKMMYAICKQVGVVFLGIVQPSLYSLEERRESEEVLYLSGHSEIMKTGLEQIIEEVRKCEEDWIYNFSEIFNEYESYPFMDRSHLYSDANEFLAKKIYSLIEGRRRRL